MCCNEHVVPLQTFLLYVALCVWLMMTAVLWESWEKYPVYSALSPEPVPICRQNDLYWDPICFTPVRSNWECVLVSCTQQAKHRAEVFTHKQRNVFSDVDPNFCRPTFFLKLLCCSQPKLQSPAANGFAELQRTFQIMQDGSSDGANESFNLIKP